MKKKFSLLIALMSLAGLIAIAPLTANAQDDAQAEFERVWYDTCYAKKDVEKCYQQSKELLEKYTKSTYIENAKVKVKEGVGWKDPNNYWLRSTIYSAQYTELKRPYDAMTEEQKGSDAGKDILKKVNELLDTKLIPEYARVIATATNPNAKPFLDAVKPQFDILWKFRTDAPDKAVDYVKNYVNGPVPTTVPGAVKLQASGPASVPGGNGAAEKKTSVKGSRKRGRG